MSDTHEEHIRNVADTTAEALPLPFVLMTKILQESIRVSVKTSVKLQASLLMAVSEGIFLGINEGAQETFGSH